MNIEIKIANKEDLKEILDLQHICYKENAIRYNDFNIQPLTQSLQELEEEFDRGLILKAEAEGKIIGSVRAYKNNNTCYIGKLIVDPSYQNRGIGQKLMKEIENSYSDVSRFELFTGFKDEKNIYLYNKLGYKVFKEEKLSPELTFLFFEKII